MQIFKMFTSMLTMVASQGNATLNKLPACLKNPGYVAECTYTKIKITCNLHPTVSSDVDGTWNNMILVKHVQSNPK